MESLTKEHEKKFKKEPYIIGMFWNDQEQLLINIELAIETNKPYDERDLLSKEELKAFENGELVF